VQDIFGGVAALDELYKLHRNRPHGRFDSRFPIIAERLLALGTFGRLLAFLDYSPSLLVLTSHPLRDCLNIRKHLH